MGTYVIGALVGYAIIHLILNATAVTNSIMADYRDLVEELGGDTSLVVTSFIPTVINAVAWMLGYSVLLTYRGAMQNGFMIYPDFDWEEEEDA